MSEEKPKAEAAGDAPAQPKQSPIILVVVMVVALVAGAALGGLLIGPQLAGGKVKAKPAAAAGEGKDEHGKPKDEKVPILKIENVIVNPAGSQGMHFLMASFALEVPDPKLEARLKEHEPELRDLAITLLEGQTMQQLGTPGARDRIKLQFLQQIEPITGKNSNIRVFLPQFVIQ